MLTVVIPTFNNENSITKVIKSAKDITNEIIIIDSFSTDLTVDIAKKLGASIFQREYNYSANQKNYILEKVKSKWVLMLDSDEILSEGLKSDIRQLTKNGIPDNVIAYRIPFIHYFWGKPISNIIDKKIKLFRTDFFRFEDKLVHAHPATESHGEIKTFDSPVYHFGIKSIKDWFHKMNIYSTWDAKERKKRKKVYKWEILFKPPIYLLKSLIIEKEMVFGFHGLIYSIMKTIIFFQTLIKHYEICNQSNDDFMFIKNKSFK